ncbi:MAG: T9SS type A sorting domain-containing protein [Bacteroidetes bacterium]|nr:T9SS type A sorting domain-containing protein [Bacteroidota bacterium]
MLLFSTSIRTAAQIVSPVNSDVHVASVVPQLPGRDDIYGIDGRQLQSGDAEADHPIHISQLPAGSYILRLQSASETRAFPFVKP